VPSECGKIPALRSESGEKCNGLHVLGSAFLIRLRIVAVLICLFPAQAEAARSTSSAFSPTSVVSSTAVRRES